MPSKITVIFNEVFVDHWFFSIFVVFGVGFVAAWIYDWFTTGSVNCKSVWLGCVGVIMLVDLGVYAGFRALVTLNTGIDKSDIAPTQPTTTQPAPSTRPATTPSATTPMASSRSRFLPIGIPNLKNSPIVEDDSATSTEAQITAIKSFGTFLHFALMRARVPPDEIQSFERFCSKQGFPRRDDSGIASEIRERRKVLLKTEFPVPDGWLTCRVTRDDLANSPEAQGKTQAACDEIAAAILRLEAGRT